MPIFNQALTSGKPSDTVATNTAPQNERDLIGRTIITLQRLRYFRRQYDQRRAYFYRLYLSSRDRKLFPDNLTPRSNTFVPFPHKNVETVVAHTMDAFFAIDPPIETRKRGYAPAGNSDAMQWVLLTGLKRAKWKNELELLTRNIAIYGFGGIAVDWDFDYDTVSGPEPVYAMMPQVGPDGRPVIGQDGRPIMTDQPIINPQTGQPIQTSTQMVTKRVPRNCPKLTAIDAFDLMVDPDGGMVARLMEKTLAQLQREAEANPTLYKQESIKELVQAVSTLEPDHPEEVLVRMAELWDETNNTVTLITYGQDAEAITWKDLRYSYRMGTYSAFKRKVYAGKAILLRHYANPFAHQRIPILYTSYTKLPNEIYGLGLIEKCADLVEGVNNFTNMIADNWNMGINRRYAYDTQADIDHTALSEANTPGGKVGVTGDPSKVLMPLPFLTPAAQDYQIIELYKQMIDMVTGITDFASGGAGEQVTGAAGVTVSQVLTEGNYLFRMFIRNMEEDILQPMLQMCASNFQQFGTDELEYEITNAPPEIPKYGTVKLETLLGSYDFDFVGANYATDKVVRQRQLMAFYNLAAQTPWANQGAFLREIAKSMQIPNAVQLVRTDAEVQQLMQRQQQMSAQMEVLKALLQMESKAVVAEVKNAKASNAAPNGDTSEGPTHGLAAQAEVERIITEDVFERLNLLPTGPAVGGVPNPGGRPPNAQFEGTIPGGGIESTVRSMAQGMGANALGLGGMRNA